MSAITPGIPKGSTTLRSRSGLQGALYDSRFINSLAGFALGPFVTIFSLHRPTSRRHPHVGTDVGFLGTALQKLRDSGFTFVSLDDVISAGLAESQLPPRSVCFTVDDGYADQARELLPIFNAFEAKATFFVITDFLDGKEWPWDEKISYLLEHCKAPSISGLSDFVSQDQLSLADVDEKRRARRLLQTEGKNLPAARIPAFLQRLSEACCLEIPEQAPAGYEPMSWEQARQLEAGGTTIAPHSCNHYITSRIPLAEAERQFSQSWQRLTEELRKPGKIYCYPTGRPIDFGPEHEQLLARGGYRGAVSFISTPLRLSHFGEMQYRLPRIGFPDTLPLVMRYAGWFEALRSLNA